MEHVRIYLLFTLLCITEGYEYDPNSIPHVNAQKLKNAIASGNQELLVFFYTNYEECPECKILMPKFHEAVDYLNKLEDGKVISYKMALKFPEYGVNNFPQLLLFLHDVPFRYDGEDRGEEAWAVDDVLHWVEEAKQTPVQELTDETFEHLTQASSGATTGDWLVLFADRKRPECLKPYLPSIGTVGVRMRMRKNVAYVDISENQKTYERFNDILKTKCAAMLFFHRTEVYLVPNKDYSPGSLIKFILEEFQFAEHVNVPSEESLSHSRLEEAVETLERLLEEYVQMSTIRAAVVICIFVLVICFSFFWIKKFAKRKIL